MILPLYVSLERIDPALYNAATDLGATPCAASPPRRAAARRPGLIAGLILVGVPAIGEYVIPQILGGGKTLMFGNIIANQFQDTGDYPFGSALAVSLMPVLMVMLLARRRAQRRWADVRPAAPPDHRRAGLVVMRSCGCR